MSHDLPRWKNLGPLVGSLLRDPLTSFPGVKINAQKYVAWLWFQHRKASSCADIFWKWLIKCLCKNSFGFESNYLSRGWGHTLLRNCSSALVELLQNAPLAAPTSLWFSANRWRLKFSLTHLGISDPERKTFKLCVSAIYLLPLKSWPLKNCYFEDRLKRSCFFWVQTPSIRGSIDSHGKDVIPKSFKAGHWLQGRNHFPMERFFGWNIWIPQKHDQQATFSLNN